LVAALTSVSASSAIASGQQTKKPFTVADEIGLAHFGELGDADALRFSPDGTYFVVWTERGRVDLNKVEDSMRFYRSQDVENFLNHSDGSQPPSPVWVVTLSTEKEGPIIGDWRWLSDSSGIAFLERTAGGNKRLVLADLRKKAIKALTSRAETVGTFDVRDGRHYVYTIADPVAEREKVQAERQAPAIVVTGRSLYKLLFPDDLRLVRLALESRNYLWAVIGGKRFQVKSNGAPLVPEADSGNSLHLALSPDHRSLVTTLPVAEVPPSWERLYPPPYASSPYRMRAGKDWSGEPLKQYVRIDLQTGSVQALTDAPTSNSAGWFMAGPSGPSWSSDGQEILLPGTFLKFNENVPDRPCVAVVDLSSNTSTCVETLKGHTATGVEQGYHGNDGVRFAGGDKQRVMVSFHHREDYNVLETIEYRQRSDGTWNEIGQAKGVPELGATQIYGLSEVEHAELTVAVKQGLNDPPRLVATYKQKSHAIWDPNKQLRNIELGQASVYKWKDKEGRDRVGGLYKPSDYTLGRRYPLVIQTHGFPGELEFTPSGLYSTAFAARALAAAGVVVLQVEDQKGCPIMTPGEGPCAVSGYEGGANELVSEGVVDPEKIGIIGFSRSCFYVLEALTSSSLHFKAASITDGVTMTYFHYLLSEGAVGNDDQEDDRVIGAKPFGEGLEVWLKRSPSFNFGKVSAPLLVAAAGPAGFLGMWEPYAVLRYLHKPVESIMFNSVEHVLTNPAVRMASQGGSVDWFRFWLQDYEDPDPAKAEQYARWRNLRKMQVENEEKARQQESKSDAPAAQGVN